MHGSRISGCAIRFSGASDAVAQQPLSAAILAGVDEAIVHRNMSQSFKESSATGKAQPIFLDYPRQVRCQMSAALLDN